MLLTVCKLQWKYEITAIGTLNLYFFVFSNFSGLFQAYTDLFSNFQNPFAWRSYRKRPKKLFRFMNMHVPLQKLVVHIPHVYKHILQCFIYCQKQTWMADWMLCSHWTLTSSSCFLNSSCNKHKTRFDSLNIKNKQTLIMLHVTC